MILLFTFSPFIGKYKMKHILINKEENTMAFKTKKRQAAPDSGEQEVDTETQETTQTTNGKNVVATQFWVANVLKRFWNWTKFFATQQLRVAGPMHAERVKTLELETNDLYTHRFTILDDDGRPAVITIKNGVLDVNYDFRDVFLYTGELAPLKYVWRFPESAISNFIGLTPYETYVNFVPFESNETATLEGKEWPRLCSANGKDALCCESPILVKCPRTQKITGLEILDETGELVRSVEITPIQGEPTRILTINMPCFKKGDETQYVCLPSSGTIEEFNNNGVLPPFLRPIDCECGCHHPVRPCPAETLSPDIFDDGQIDDSDHLFDDDDSGNGWMDFDESTKDEYEVAYEAYATNTYSNVILKNSDFNTNEKQFLRVVVETV